jgi:hypothetical protein
VHPNYNLLLFVFSILIEFVVKGLISTIGGINFNGDIAVSVADNRHCDLLHSDFHRCFQATQEYFGLCVSEYSNRVDVYRMDSGAGVVSS